MGDERDQETARGRMGERRDAAVERMGERRDAAVEAMATARGNAADAMATAKENTAEAMASAKVGAAEAIAKVKPRLRGVSHEWAFFLSLGLGAALIIAAEGARATVAVAIYAASLSALFGVSALYHRINWSRPEVRRWMRRLDHTMIFLLIAGTITPFALLVLDGGFAKALLIGVWGAALGGIVVELIWIDAPKWLAAIVYVAVGLIGAVAFPEIVSRAGVGAGILIAAGGVLYIAGAVIYAVERPNPSPTVFGYHEIFHVLVIVAAATHFAAVAFFALPAA
ncbi:MAG: PAQR family membrane homeostasis protein TrhA [Solirubrobacterales bacterium]